MILEGSIQPHLLSCQPPEEFVLDGVADLEVLAGLFDVAEPGVDLVEGKLLAGWVDLAEEVGERKGLLHLWV